jgi:putative endonuclease
MSYYTYCIQSEEGFHYTGQTQDLDIRILRHHLRTTHYTKKGTNWKVMYSKLFETRAEAMKHEKWLKSGLGREWLKKNIAGCLPACRRHFGRQGVPLK